MPSTIQRRDDRSGPADLLPKKHVARELLANGGTKSGLDVHVGGRDRAPVDLANDMEVLAGEVAQRHVVCDVGQGNSKLEIVAVTRRSTTMHYRVADNHGA